MAIREGLGNPGPLVGRDPLTGHDLVAGPTLVASHDLVAGPDPVASHDLVAGRDPFPMNRTGGTHSSRRSRRTRQAID